MAEVKNPRQPTFVKQQNIAHQQQVNNGVPLAHAREEIVETSNKLIKEERHAQLDAGRAAKAIGTHPKVETWKFSTGPTTAAGKKRVSRNAAKHGAFSRENKELRREINALLKKYRGPAKLLSSS
jgi:hypothetical protein